MRTSEREITQSERLESYIKKTEKEKKGGMCPGFVGRDRRTGKDYLIKRPLNAPIEGNWRVWDEVLAAKLCKHAGILVPDIFAVEDRSGFVYLASAILPGTSNCTKEDFHRLPSASKEPVFCSLMMHAWLGNRDLINIHGENFVMDRDKRVFFVDLGGTLCIGFRSHGFQNEDTINVTADTILPFFLASDNSKYGLMQRKSGTLEFARNIKQIRDFFGEEYFANQREYHARGAIIVQQFSNQDIEDIVNSTGHTPQAKAFRIRMLQQRRDALISAIQTKYNDPDLLEAEKIAQLLQRILHRLGYFKVPAQRGNGLDAGVGYAAQFLNAVKPKVTFLANNQICIESNEIERLVTILGLDERVVLREENRIVLSTRDRVCDAIYSKFITNSLQACFYSFGHLRENHAAYRRHDAFKGAGEQGFEPVLSTEGGTTVVTLPQAVDAANIRHRLQRTFSLQDREITVADNGHQLCVHTSLAKFAWRMMADVSVRKTAIVSENQEGQILAGKLDQRKKAVAGFATAGGNAEYPYDAERSAREEGVEELGYGIQGEAPLIPLGSTLVNQQANIFLAPAGGTALAPTHRIDYAEFQNDSIRYYHFHQLASECRRAHTQVDRSSVDLYLRYYQEKIQSILNEKLADSASMLVHISKKPQSLGQIILKPSLAAPGRGIIMANQRWTALISGLFPGQYHLEDRVTQQRLYSRTRQCIILDPKVNPRDFYTKVTDLTAAPAMRTELMSPRGRQESVQLDASFSWVLAYSTIFLMLVLVISLTLLILSLFAPSFLLPLITSVLPSCPLSTLQYGLGASALASLGVFGAPKIQRCLWEASLREARSNPGFEASVP
ncbi:MAG: hypothetical protein KBB94_01630 [Legionellaceae bacterium]|nr:hypothetical protein [Legionellaceae bacterium]MBP9774594.1 hypothetical protein [Legionellaceae bacterium]